MQGGAEYTEGKAMFLTQVFACAVIIAIGNRPVRYLQCISV